MRKLEGKVAIVTGSAQGIGAAYARRLGQLGATVVIADIAEDASKKCAEELSSEGIDAVAHRVDIADHESTEELIADTIRDAGKVDILVNNAAMYAGLTMDSAEDVDLGYWRKMVDVNITGTYLMCRAVIPSMRAQESGCIVNQASIAAYLGSPLSIHYTTTKAAVIGMTKVLARELGEDNIRVNTIAPGVIDTPATQGAVPSMLQEMLILNAALGRLGQPEDLLGVLELLCSDASSYITGQTFVVDGGVYTLG